jgi:hypothetical protein
VFLISLILCTLVLLSHDAWGEDFTCGDTTKLHRYSHAVDPTRVEPCPAPYVLAEIPHPQIGAQRSLYNQHAHAGTVRYLKVVEGLMVEKTQAEKDAVDLPLQQQAAAHAVAQQEVQTNEVCANHTLTEITAYWKGPGGKEEQLQTTIAALDLAIAAVTGPAQTALSAAREALVAHMTMFINDSELSWRYLCSRTFLRP